MKISTETYKRLLNNSINAKQSKYKNKKIIIDGIKFDSQKEGYRYLYLKRLQEIDTITELELQKAFKLQPKYINNNGEHIRAIKYIADFFYYDKKTKKYIVEDVKGIKTEVYKLKKKIFEYQYPNLTINEI